MADDGEEISYLALANGTPVQTASGAPIGVVEHVLQVPELDLFDGIVVAIGRHQLRFVDREQIEKITTSAVHTSLTDDQAANLPPPSGNLVERVDPFADEGSSLSARFGRMFGRSHWLKNEGDPPRS